MLPKKSDQQPWLDDRITANGASVQENFKSWFGDSVVVGDTGEPIVMYHATLSSFDAFEIGDVGFHFGTLTQAEDRMKKILQFQDQERGQYEGGENIIPVYLSIKNPLRMNDAGDWDNPEMVATYVGEIMIEDDAFEASYLSVLDKLGSAASFTDIFVEMGYDGIVYQNTAEGPGEDSWIAFNANQVKSVLGNSGLYLKDSSSLTDSESEELLIAAKSAQRFLDSLGKSAKIMVGSP